MKNTISLVLVLTLGLASVSLGAGDAWTQKADMPTTRLALAASVVNGKIYAIGGRAEGTLTTEYDPATDTWTTKTPMPTARFGLATSVVDGKIYAIGGAPGPGSIFRTVGAYDPQTDTWTKKADMPTANAFFSTSVVDGKIYAIGGGAVTPWSTHFRTVYAYDPLTDTWTQKADMPTARAYLSTCVVDGKIYAIGGALASKTILSTVEVCDPVTDTWTTQTPMPTARRGLATAVVDGIIYAIGGGTTPSPAFPVVEAYDPATDTWTTKDDMPAPRAFLSTGVVDGKIYAFGGGYVIHPPGFRTVYEYEPNPLIVDFNGDGIVDSADISMMLDYWGTDEPFFDIAPMPLGDGIVDVQDLIVLAEHLFTYPGAVAYWNLDETEGDIASDSANDNDGTVYGDPAWQPEGGIVGGALEFDGIDDYISISSFMSTVTKSSLSVFTWIKGGMPGQVIISQKGRSDWLLADTTEGSLMTELKFLGMSGVPLYSHAVITDGNWHRVGLVWDGSNRILYVDDVEVVSDTYDKGRLFGRLQIGAGMNLDPGTFFSGLIDDVRIYNRAVIP
jgi:N-acetylneuraminic acid mutarotase